MPIYTVNVYVEILGDNFADVRRSMKQMERGGARLSDCKIIDWETTSERPSIEDHPFTPKADEPTRCQTCDGVQEEHKHNA